MPAHPPAVSKGDHIRGHPSILTPTGVTRHTRTLNGPSAGLLLAGISAQLERSPEAKPQASHPRKWLGLKRGPSQVSCRRQRLPDCHGAGTSVRRCMPHGVRHPDGETDRRSRRRGRAAGIPATTIRMPPVSSIWIPGRRWAPAPDHPAGRNPEGGHARERCGGAGRRGPGHQGAGGCGCPERPSSYSGITLSDEGGQGERTRTRRSAWWSLEWPPVPARRRSGSYGWLRRAGFGSCADP